MRTFLIFILLILTREIYAKSLFETDFYEINFISENIETDKINKITNIKYKSIDKILSNILIKNDYNIVKKDIDENLINTFIKNIIIEQEKIINNNYYAKIKVNYKKKSIISYLRKLKLPYLEKIPNQMLIIIFENNFLDNLTFSINNKYYNYLNKNNNFYKIPNFDINDKYLLSNIDIEKNFNKNLNIISKKYSSPDSILLVINNDDEITYNIFLYTNDELLEVYNTKNIDNDYEYLFNQIKYETLNKWKTLNKIQNDFVSLIKCEIKYFNLKELKEIKYNLDNISIIKNIILKKISYKLNFYDIYYYGDINHLSELFETNRLSINYNNNYCKILLK